MENKFQRSEILQTQLKFHRQFYFTSTFKCFIKFVKNSVLVLLKWFLLKRYLKQSPKSLQYNVNNLRGTKCARLLLVLVVDSFIITSHVIQAIVIQLKVIMREKEFWKWFRSTSTITCTFTDVSFHITLVYFQFVGTPWTENGPHNFILQISVLET